MADEREFYAATVHEALEKAAEDLGLPSDELPHRVLDEGNTGFLGIGARDARIVVEAPAQNSPVAEPPETISADSEVSEALEPEPSENDEPLRSSTLSEVYGETAESEQVEAPQELLDEVRVLVSSILDAMGFEASVEVYDAG